MPCSFILRDAQMLQCLFFGSLSSFSSLSCHFMSIILAFDDWVRSTVGDFWKGWGYHHSFIHFVIIIPYTPLWYIFSDGGVPAVFDFRFNHHWSSYILHYTLYNIFSETRAFYYLYYIASADVNLSEPSHVSCRIWFLSSAYISHRNRLPR